MKECNLARLFFFRILLKKIGESEYIRWEKGGKESMRLRKGEGERERRREMIIRREELFSGREPTTTNSTWVKENFFFERTKVYK